MLQFRNLDAYHHAVALLEVTSVVADEVPRPQQGLADRLERAALAVLRALAEGSHRQHAGQSPFSDRGEARHCYAIARGAAFECVGIIDTLDRLHAVSLDDATRTREIIARLVSLLCRLEAESTGDLDPHWRKLLASLAPAPPAQESG